MSGLKRLLGDVFDVPVIIRWLSGVAVLGAVWSAGRRSAVRDATIRRLRNYQRTKTKLEGVPRDGGSSDMVDERIRRAARMF